MCMSYCVALFIGQFVIGALQMPYYYYLRQVNEVNGGDNVFVRCVCVCVCVRLSVCLYAADRWELNANSSKTVKATDFKFDMI